MSEVAPVEHEEQCEPEPEPQPEAPPKPIPMPDFMIAEQRQRAEIPREVLSAVFDWKERVREVQATQASVVKLVSEFYGDKDSDKAPVSEMVKTTQINRALDAEGAATRARTTMKLAVENWARRPW